MLVVPVAGATQLSRSFTESIFVSIVLAELAVVFGIAFAYYGGATGGPVIVLVAVAIYVITVLLGKLRTALGDETAPELGSIDAGEAESPSD
jgi:zinc transport system permease protein